MGNFKCETLPFGLKITSENIQNQNQESLSYYYEKFWIEFAAFLVFRGMLQSSFELFGFLSKCVFPSGG